MINLFALLCIPLALPSLFLCLTLTQKKFLGTVFNGGAAVMFAVSGNIFGLYSVCIVLVHCNYIQNIHLNLGTISRFVYTGHLQYFSSPVAE